jgi:hypothetical protein
MSRSREVRRVPGTHKLEDFATGYRIGIDQLISPVATAIAELHPSACGAWWRGERRRGAASRLGWHQNGCPLNTSGASRVRDAHLIRQVTGSSFVPVFFLRGRACVEVVVGERDFPQVYRGRRGVQVV